MPKTPENRVSALSPRLLIHIGYGKCASTYIQESLRINKDMLLKNKVLLSDSGLVGPCNHGLSYQYCSQAGKPDLRSESLHTLFEEVKRLLPGEILIASSEYLVGDGDWLVDLLSRFANHVNITVLVYLKRQDRLLESWYYQELINGKRLAQPIGLLGDELWLSGILNYGEFCTNLKLTIQGLGGKLIVHSLDYLKAQCIEPFHAFLFDVGMRGVLYTCGLLAPSKQAVNSKVPLESLYLIQHLHGYYGVSVFDVFMSCLPEWYPLGGDQELLAQGGEGPVLVTVSSDKLAFGTGVSSMCF